MQHANSLSVDEWMGAIAAADAAKKDKAVKGDHEKNWFLRPVVGKLPGYGVVLVGGGLLGVVGYLVKRFVFHK